MKLGPLPGGGCVRRPTPTEAAVRKKNRGALLAVADIRFLGHPVITVYLRKRAWRACAAALAVAGAHATPHEHGYSHVCVLACAWHVSHCAALAKCRGVR